MGAQQVQRKEKALAQDPHRHLIDSPRRVDSGDEGKGDGWSVDCLSSMTGGHCTMGTTTP